MDKQVIETGRAPRAVGPYSQAVKVSGMLYTSGVLPLDPVTGELAGGGIEKETEQVFKNLEALCEEAGTSLDRVLLMNVFITDMKNFDAMNNIYAGYFSGSYPARATVEVSALARGAGIEIQAIVLC